MLKKQAKLKLEEVKHVARLANLPLTESELKKIQQQLSKVVDYVGQLAKLKTENVQPTTQVTGLENIFREDKVTASLTQDEALANTKQQLNGYFVVKKILE